MIVSSCRASHHSRIAPRCAFVLVPVTTCYEDLDGDGDVDGFDMAILLGSDGPCEIPGLCIADLNCTREVDGFDLAILLGAWGSCPGFGGGAGATAMAGGPETGESGSSGPPTLAQQVDWLMDHGLGALVPALIEMWSQIDS